MALPNTKELVRKTVGPVVTTMKQWGWRLLPYKPDRMTQEHYDALYSSGHLNYYKSISEMARYSVIVGYCHYFKPSGALLDLGCGAGILQERLNWNNYSRYVGVDRSKEAIGQALTREDEKTLFVVADATVYLPNRTFDVIIFNECLYHFDDPISIVRRYENFLNSDGLLIISICDHERTKPLWKMIEAAYHTFDEVRIVHKPKLSWTVKVIGTSKNNA
jgi:2-polyprenyl-3-methyl-5-hydroxy-6-metoxy-1,4-benzoquinol methylase